MINKPDSAREIWPTGAVTIDHAAGFTPGLDIGASDWMVVDQAMISAFGAVTRDPDPMHVDPAWARRDGPYDDTIAFGFLTMSLLTNLLHSALGTCSERVPTSGHYLNLGFDRLRLVSPVPVDSRIRGHFKVGSAARDARGRIRVSFDARIEVEGSDRPALVAQWLSIWVPDDQKGAPDSSPAV